MAPAQTQSRKIYPSRAKGVVHPCRASGMKHVYFFIHPELKSKLKTYCKAKRITQGGLIKKLLVREFGEHYEAIVTAYNKRQRVQKRGKAYRYVLAHSRQSAL